MTSRSRRFTAKWPTAILRFVFFLSLFLHSFLVASGFDRPPLAFTCRRTLHFRIFDIVLYHNEAYTLLIRLRTLRPYVTKHYVGFSLLSFSHSVHHTLSFFPWEPEILNFSDRVFWFNYTHPPHLEEPWDREAAIRHQLVHQMELHENPLYDDLVIWSDVDEIPLPRGMRWVEYFPPKVYYRFFGFFHFYNYRWRSPRVWEWAYIMRYGAKNPNKTWFAYRAPDEGIYERIPGISLVHCSYCFPSMSSIIEKLKSFSHVEFSGDPYINPNYVYGHVYCGHSLFGGAFKLVEFDPDLGLDIPDDPKFDFLKHRLKFDDLNWFMFDIEIMKKMAPCNLTFADGVIPDVI
jgi:hypothetical protein